MKQSILLMAFFCGFPLFAVPRAARTAQVDANGVLRWTDDNREVALLGVNYYPPFTVDYDALLKRRIGISKTMREDVAHFRRLGLTCVRIHCFDRQFSTPEGDFIDNDHVQYLDELIDLCAQNGIYMVLTPIAWWGGTYASGPQGFSARFPMPEMTSNHAAWAIQAKFLKAFGEHVNHVTGRRYADEPSILAFECINEPLYPKNHPDSEVTAYIDALVDGLRASGTKKPIFYNSWQRRNAAAGASKADGITGSYYPTGLVAGHALHGPQLSRVVASSLHPDAAVAKKAKMIYEFDAADTPGSYMYPTMGRLFRHEGVQVAAMFQYDPMPLAPYNRGWQTHFLNLVYAPRKALSIAIMAEVFRQVPRGVDYTPECQEQVFPPFRADAARDLSEYVGPDAYIYTNDPITPPRDVAALRHIGGCGKSAVAASSGSGAYFLDRVADGVWRLQVYPSTFQIADPYSGGARQKVVVLPDAIQMAVHLPDLGTAWRATPLGGTVPVSTAVDGSATLMPGDYALTRTVPSLAALAQAAAADLPPYFAPAPDPVQPRLTIEVPAQFAGGTDMPLEVARSHVRTITAELVRADGSVLTCPLAEKAVLPAAQLTVGDWHVRFKAVGDDGTVLTLPGRDEAEFKTGYTVHVRPNASNWELFDVPTALRRHAGIGPAWSSRGSDDGGQPSLRLQAKSFAGAPDSSSLRLVTDATTRARQFPRSGRGRALLVRARAVYPQTDKIEIAIVQTSGAAWGTNMPLTPEWKTHRIPLDSLRYFKHWGLPDLKPGEQPDIRQTLSVNLCFGRWLYPKTFSEPQGFEISSIKVEDEETK